MREIKFRAWDLHNQRMVEYPYMFELWQDFRGENNYGASFVFFEDWHDVEDGIARPCHIMQFIGLRDRNGKEIYEGDIVRVDDSVCGNPIDGYKDGVYKVEYCLPDCAFCLVQLDEKSGISFNEGMEYEVIGSIYENPELLNK